MSREEMQMKHLRRIAGKYVECHRNKNEDISELPM